MKVLVEICNYNVIFKILFNGEVVKFIEPGILSSAIK